MTPWQRPAQGLEVSALEHFPGVVSHNEDGIASPLSDCSPSDGERVSVGSARHRRHRFPARNRVVKVCYDDREHAAAVRALAGPPQHPDGHDHPAPGTFATKTAADKWLAAVETGMARGTWVDPRSHQLVCRRWPRPSRLAAAC